jgi:hypothetical protein
MSSTVLSDECARGERDFRTLESDPQMDTARPLAVDQIVRTAPDAVTRSGGQLAEG